MTSTSLQSLSSDRSDKPSGHNAHLVDTSAAVVAVAALDNRSSTQEDSTIDVDFVASPVSDVSDTPDSNRLTHSPDHLPHARETTLNLQTDLTHPAYGYATPVKSTRRPAVSLRNQSSTQSLRPVSRTPSLKAGIYGPFGSASAASSTVASPIIAAMGDLTPFPSPLLAGDSPGPWKQLGRRMSREAAMSPPASGPLDSNDQNHVSGYAKKGYAGLTSGPAPADGASQHQNGRLARPPLHHTRNRSVSEYIPDPMLIPKRMSTVSGTRVSQDLKSTGEGHLRREPHLSEARGLTPIEKPPTPPPSESSLSTTDLALPAASATSGSKRSSAEYFEAHGRYDRKRRRWRAVRVLGQGTFSQVYLATSQISSSSSDDEDCSPGTTVQNSDQAPAHERRSLVAVKVCEHGPRGGASEDRIEMSLKRELEIMKSVRHPSLVNLKAWNIEPSRAILVLSYHPGGDLFDVATRHRTLLTPSLIRRIFSELVGAVAYLHAQSIVHRDIKLENVLVNLPPSELSPETDWTTYPYSVATLTDLGLSRRIAPDEKLETRCGSDDYAAPEVIMGQPYDGRATDAWSLGVLLYALLEARLPFDPPPAGPQGVDHAMQIRMRSRTSHRIARVEWRWFEYGAGEGEDGEGDHEAEPKKFEEKGMLGAMEVVEGLLKRARSRWPLSTVAQNKWVAGGVAVDGGIRFREEEEGEEV
ncbi:kinase-like domain-containing protein [Chaetomium tenue]|uniref:Kinase-like domain-containing protein n=1 Tax=Chaetomium tenue TaxID=1854479 RepID=A0ACB7PK07_9PEZI|nr:kinase-like domain-containing protein [Chaetomium globosum]